MRFLYRARDGAHIVRTNAVLFEGARVLHIDTMNGMITTVSRLHSRIRRFRFEDALALSQPADTGELAPIPDVDLEEEES